MLLEILLAFCRTLLGAQVCRLNQKQKLEQYKSKRTVTLRQFYGGNSNGNRRFRCKQTTQSLCRRFLPLAFFLMLFLPTKLVAAGCRDDVGRTAASRDCEAICQVNRNGATTDCTLRALALLPGDDTYVASLGRVLPILKVAVDRIHESQLLPNYINFEWLPHDDKCDAAYAVIQAMDGIVKNCAHVIFGPVCEYPLASVSRITKYMNRHGTPLISVGGATYDFEMKKRNCTDEFYMLLRTGTISFETISEMTIAVLKRVDKRAALIRITIPSKEICLQSNKNCRISSFLIRINAIVCQPYYNDEVTRYHNNNFN